MFNGHIGVWDLVIWLGGLLLIAVIDVVKEMRSRGQGALARGNGHRLDALVLPLLREAPRRAYDLAGEPAPQFEDALPAPDRGVLSGKRRITPRMLLRLGRR